MQSPKQSGMLRLWVVSKEDFAESGCDKCMFIRVPRQANRDEIARAAGEALGLSCDVQPQTLPGEPLQDVRKLRSNDVLVIEKRQKHRRDSFGYFTLRSRSPSLTSQNRANSKQRLSPANLRLSIQRSRRPKAFSAAYRIAIIGPTQSGKSALIAQFLHQHFQHEYLPTVYDEYETIRPVSLSNECLKLTLCDFGGQWMPKENPVGFSDAEAFILCFDASKRATFDELEEWHDQLERLFQTSNRIPPIILVETHRDCNFRAVSNNDVSMLIQKLNISHYAAVSNKSAGDATSVVDATARTIHTLRSSTSSKHCWIPDRYSDSCLSCDRRFTFWIRRHHCRLCGTLVCYKCSSFVDINAHRKRVCITCTVHI